MAPRIGVVPAKIIAQVYEPPDAVTMAEAIGVPSRLPSSRFFCFENTSSMLDALIFSVKVNSGICSILLTEQVARV